MTDQFLFAVTLSSILYNGGAPLAKTRRRTSEEGVRFECLVAMFGLRFGEELPSEQ
jgi:hypothetical protein